MRKKAFIPVLFFLLLTACPWFVNTDKLNATVNIGNSSYDSVAVFTTSQLAALKMIVDNGGTLSDAEKARAISLYDILTLLDEYKHTVDAMKLDPTTDLLKQAASTWNQIEGKAKELGWEASQ